MPAARSRGETQAKPRPNAYDGLLGLSFVALITAILFAYLNWSSVSEKPKQVQMPTGGGARSMPTTPGPNVAPGGQAAPGGAVPGGQAAPGGAVPGGAAAPVPPGGNPAPPKQ